MQYRTRLALIMISCLLMALCVELWEGGSPETVWLKGPKQAVVELLPTTRATSIALPLNAYAATWQKTLFSPLRAPDPDSVAPEAIAPSIEGITVTGIVVTPTLRMTMLKPRDGKSMTAKEGERLPNGWTVQQISDRQVELSNGAHRATLWLSGSKPKL